MAVRQGGAPVLLESEPGQRSQIVNAIYMYIVGNYSECILICESRQNLALL